MNSPDDTNMLAVLIASLVLRQEYRSEGRKYPFLMAFGTLVLIELFWAIGNKFGI